MNETTLSAHSIQQHLLACVMTHYKKLMNQISDVVKNQQKSVYKGRCYTLKRINRNDKYWGGGALIHFSNSEIKRLPWHTLHKIGLKTVYWIKQSSGG
ncbi:hypothetical protein T4B_12915 [Trichinella pseudospiralis]|uniref:Uncharacterized protein n=1 Tax=Trichinella pseudospiralis TaxID=6337 RepID=A0A0V1I1E0_TRIPS|nr:hypothetical protein T4B_12915 [Trichinella pseudospiralis]